MARIGTMNTDSNVKSVTYGNLSWINIEKPTEREIEFLAQNYPFHTLDLDDCLSLSRTQRPKIDEYEDYLFMVFHFPVFNKAARVTQPSQVSIFIGRNYLVTLHEGNLKPLVKFFRDCEINERTRQENMGRDSGYLFYQIFDRLVNYCFPILNKIGDNIDVIEDKVFTKPVVKTVRETMIIKRDVISFQRIIRPQIEIFDLLEEKEWPFLENGDMEVYFGDIGDHLDKIWDTLEDYREFIDGLSDISNWLTSHNIQEVMRVLTMAAVVIGICTVVTGIYGMNIRLPFGAPNSASGSWEGFVFPFIVMVVLIVIIFFIFRYKRWL